MQEGLGQGYWGGEGIEPSPELQDHDQGVRVQGHHYSEPWIDPQMAGQHTQWPVCSPGQGRVWHPRCYILWPCDTVPTCMLRNQTLS